MRKTHKAFYALFVVTASTAHADPVWDTSFIPNGVTGAVHALHAVASDKHARLDVGGSFTAIAGVPARNIANLDATGWHAYGVGVSNRVLSLTTYPIMGVHRLIAAGNFPLASNTALVYWDGVAWQAFNNELPHIWFSFVGVHQSPSGPHLVISGPLTSFGPGDDDYMTAWNGTNWVSYAGGLSSIIHDAIDYDDGAGPSMFAVGSFGISTPGQPSSIGIARWNGTSWLGVGAPALSGPGNAILSHDDGAGPAIYVGGGFNSAGGVQCRNIARWRNGQWSALGGGLNGAVNAIAVWNDGNGPALYVGGSFSASGSTPISTNLAVWRNGNWQPVGLGVNAVVNALEVFDIDGSGPLPPALYIGGEFTMANGSPAVGLVRLLAPPPTCPGDANSDQQVNAADLSVLLGQFGTSVTPGSGADFNADGVINAADLSILLSNFAGAC